MASWLAKFIQESNRIEGIIRDVRSHELQVHSDFLCLDEIRIGDLENVVQRIAGARLRTLPGMNVRVGSHIPPPGGSGIRESLQGILDIANREISTKTPYRTHVAYESLHPFMDGNGRSGRLLWLWQMERLAIEMEWGSQPWREIGFLHYFYYESLESGR